jgi:hypothetical protein
MKCIVVGVGDDVSTFRISETNPSSVRNYGGKGQLTKFYPMYARTREFLTKFAQKHISH